MEVTSLCEHNNKENIPPICQNQTNPVPSIVQSSTYINAKRRFRKPLRDITHLFNSAVQSTSAPDSGFKLPFPVPAAPFINLRKRKAIDDIDLVRQTSSKSLRENFR